eukprot:4851845-Amphidinium_carterae.1
MSDDSLADGLAAMENSDSTLLYESSSEKGAVRKPLVRGSSRRCVSASGDGRDIVKRRVGKEKKGEDVLPTRGGREGGQVKALEYKLRQAQRDQLSTTCEAAASASSAAQRIESVQRDAMMRVAAIDAMARAREQEIAGCIRGEEATAALVASSGEKTARLREEALVNQMKAQESALSSQLQSQVGLPERSVSELRARLSDEAAHARHRETSLSAELNRLRDCRDSVMGAEQRESALRGELSQVHGGVTMASQRVANARAEVEGLKQQMVALRAEHVRERRV